MNHDSTLHIRKDLLNKIDNAVILSGLRRSEIIHFLFQYAMNDFKYRMTKNSTVKYQRIIDGVSCERIHIWYSDDIYCFANMMRFLYRMSMSYILAESVRKHLGALIKRLLDKGLDTTDNYFFQKYDLSYKVTESTIFWEKKWLKQIQRE